MAVKEAIEKFKTINGVQHKYCSTCKKYVPIVQFSSRKASADGLAYSCKPCERKTAKESYERKKKKKEQQKYYQEHKDTYIDRQKKRYEENSEEILAKQKEWRQSDKGRKLVNKATKRRRDRIKDQTPEGAKYCRQDVIDRDTVNGVCICQICGKPITDLNGDLQIDHIVGIAAGGADTLDNVRCTHKLCNLTRPKDGSDL